MGVHMSARLQRAGLARVDEARGGGAEQRLHTGLASVPRCERSHGIGLALAVLPRA